MISELPRIAMPEPTSTDPSYNQRSLPQYIRAVAAAGGIVVPIPLEEPPAGKLRLLATCSGILLPGSPADVDPSRYGETRVRETAAPDPKREAADDLLLQDALEHGKPILGICYGLQSLNVFRKGSLIQHLPTGAVAGETKHDAGRDVVEAHPIHLSPGTRLAAVASPDLQAVNSSHHQAVARPGEGLRIAATSPEDGVIEAVEGVDPARFVLAVQWHPERTYEQSAASRAIFKAFLASAQDWKLTAAK